MWIGPSPRAEARFPLPGGPSEQYKGRSGQRGETLGRSRAHGRVGGGRLLGRDASAPGWFPAPRAKHVPDFEAAPRKEEQHRPGPSFVSISLSTRMCARVKDLLPRLRLSIVAGSLSGSQVPSPLRWFSLRSQMHRAAQMFQTRPLEGASPPLPAPRLSRPSARRLGEKATATLTTATQRGRISLCPQLEEKWEPTAPHHRRGETAFPYGGSLSSKPHKQPYLGPSFVPTHLPSIWCGTRLTPTPILCPSTACLAPGCLGRYYCLFVCLWATDTSYQHNC